MPSHCFSDIFLHLNWHCLANRPLITTSIEEELHAYLKAGCDEMPGVHHHGSGGTETHIHLLLRIEPTVLVSDVVGRLKGASAHEMNRAHGPGTLQWQRGYGVVSFARRNLRALQDYVALQKQHHRDNTVRALLERHETPTA